MISRGCDFLNRIPGEKISESFIHQRVVTVHARTRLFGGGVVVNSKDKSLQIRLVLLMRFRNGVGIER